jgi:uncharacterized membrane protein
VLLSIHNLQTMSIPPIHPALVHFPIALIIFSVIVDVLAKITNRRSLADVGFYSLIAGLIGGVLTIAAGYWDMNRADLSRITHQFVDQHLIIGWVLAVCLVFLSIWRWRISAGNERAVSRPYIAAAVFTLALTCFQGWYGGEMVFAHGAGVAPAGQGTEPAQIAQQRLARVHDALAPPASAVGGTGKGESGRAQSDEHSSEKHEH